MKLGKKSFSNSVFREYFLEKSLCQKLAKSGKDIKMGSNSYPLEAGTKSSVIGNKGLIVWPENQAFCILLVSSQYLGLGISSTVNAALNSISSGNIFIIVSV